MHDAGAAGAGTVVAAGVGEAGAPVAPEEAPVLGGAVAADSPTASCVNCGAQLGGRWCAACGQQVLARRHTLRSMATGALGRVFNLERGIVHTVWRLTVDPGQVVRDYCAGRTVCYVHPAGYVLLMFAAFFVTAELTGGGTGLSGSSNRVFIALLIPFVAAASRVLFFRERLNYAEHLIIGMYVFGHIVLVLTLLLVAVALTGGRAPVPLTVAALAAAAGYYVWAWMRVFPQRALIAAVAGVFALVAGAAAWSAALVKLVQLLRH